MSTDCKSKLLLNHLESLGYNFYKHKKCKDIDIIKNNITYGFFEVNIYNNEYEIICNDFTLFKILIKDLKDFDIYIWDCSDNITNDNFNFINNLN